jgi:hypothetical protein
MKFKRALSSAIVIASVFALVGCSKESTTTVNVPVSEIQEAVLVDSLLNVEQDSIDAKDHWMFADVADKIEEGFVSQALMNVKLQDIIVVKTTDADAIVAAIEDYKESSLQLFSGGYGGDENAEAAANAILEIYNDYVYFIATPNANEIEAQIMEKLK